MKNLIFFCLFLCYATNGNAQKAFSINEKGGPIVTCDSVSVDTEKSIYEFTGNVCFKTADIDIEKAQKVILNGKSKKVIVTAFEKVTMTNDCALTIYGKCEKNILVYKLGTRRLLVN